MATVHFAKILLVLLLACRAITAAPIPQRVTSAANEHEISAESILGVEGLEHHSGEKLTDVPHESIQSRFRDGSMAALQETGKIFQTAAMLPVEALQLVRLLTMPVIDATLSLPANVLQGAETMSSKGFEGFKAQARSSTSGLLSFLTGLKQFKQSLLPHIGISKNFTLGPLSFHKTIEFGAPKKEVTTPPPTPEVYATPRPAPMVPVPEVPKVNVVIPATTPAPCVGRPAISAPPVPSPVVPVVVTPAVVAPPSDGAQVQVATVVVN